MPSVSSQFLGWQVSVIEVWCSLSAAPNRERQLLPPRPKSMCRAVLSNAPWLSWGSPLLWATVMRQWAKAPHKSSAAILSLRPDVVSSYGPSKEFLSLLRMLVAVHVLAGVCSASRLASSMTVSAKDSAFSSATSGFFAYVPKLMLSGSPILAPSADARCLPSLEHLLSA